MVKTIPGKMAKAGVVLAALAGAYYLYGTKDGAKNRRKMASVMLRFKADVIDALEEVKDASEESYGKVIDTVAKKYEAVKGIDLDQMKEMKSDLKSHWKNIKKELVGAKKNLKKGVEDMFESISEEEN